MGRVVLCELSFCLEAQAGVASSDDDNLSTEIRDVLIWAEVIAAAEHGRYRGMLSEFGFFLSRFRQWQLDTLRLLRDEGCLNINRPTANPTDAACVLAWQSDRVNRSSNFAAVGEWA